MCVLYKIRGVSCLQWQILFIFWSILIHIFFCNCQLRHLAPGIGFFPADLLMRGAAPASSLSQAYGSHKRLPRLSWSSSPAAVLRWHSSLCVWYCLWPLSLPALDPHISPSQCSSSSHYTARVISGKSFKGDVQWGTSRETHRGSLQAVRHLCF